MIIDGKKIAEGLREKLKKKIKEFKSNLKIAPGLSVILVGEDPASQIYVKNKIKYSKEIGIDSEVIRYPKNIQEKIVLDKGLKQQSDPKELEKIISKILHCAFFC